MHFQSDLVMKRHFSYALAMGSFIAISSTTLHAQGLFAKAGQQAEKAVAVFESIWDDFYGKLDELLIAEVDKENGDLAFDSEKGIASFTVFLKVNEEAYDKWEKNAWSLLEACGIKEETDPWRSWRFGRKRFFVNDNTAAEINRAAAEGELTLPTIGIVVKLVDEKGKMLQYAALPLGEFKNGTENSGICVPAFLMDVRDGVYFQEKDRSSSRDYRKPASLFISFAGTTRKSLLSVSDIQCQVLVGQKFTEECRRLAMEKIEADSKLFADHGIESKVVTLPGGVPLAVNRTPRGTWFGRFEVTRDQWQAVMESQTDQFQTQPQQSGGLIIPEQLRKMLSAEELRQLESASGEELSQIRAMLDQLPDAAKAELGGLAAKNLNEFVSMWEKSSDRYTNSPDIPVDGIGWFKAMEFIGKLNALPQVREAGLVFEMPKGRYTHGNYANDPNSHWNHGEPEWEYGCLGAKAYGAEAMHKQAVIYGLDLDGNKMELVETGWCKVHEESSLVKKWAYETPHPVGMKRPNAFGLYDMIGNVSEMVDEQGDSMPSFRTEKCPYMDASAGYLANGTFSMEDADGRPMRGFRLFARLKSGSSKSSTSASGVVVAGNSADDSELAQALTEAGIEFSSKANEKGFTATFSMEGDRTQMVVIDADVKTADNIEVREVCSAIVKSEKCPVSAEQMRRLLVQSGGRFLGHICLAKPSQPGQKWLLYYSAKVPSNARASELEATIRECASIADQWEKELVGTDDN